MIPQSFRLERYFARHEFTIVEQEGHEVIYGDTDSIFLWIRNAKSQSDAKAAGRSLEREAGTWGTLISGSSSAILVEAVVSRITMIRSTWVFTACGSSMTTE